jgi:hypothetical protein
MTIGEARKIDKMCQCGCLFSEHDFVPYVGLLSIIPCTKCGYIKRLFGKSRMVCTSFWPMTNLQYLEQKYNESLTTI